jgi:hypothetical protein
MASVIENPRDVTPALLANLLQPPKGVCIESVRVEFERELPFSRIARLLIEHNGDPRELPHSLFLKLNGPTTPFSANEVDFYLDVAALDATQPIPKCYHAASDVDAERWHLLLEDLTDTHFQTPQETAPDRSSSEAAVAALAGVHARWWCSPEVGVSVGKVFDESWLERFVDELEQSIDLFINEAGTDLPGDVLDALRLMVRNAETIWGRLTVRKGLTVTHGDVHWWNFMFPLDPRDLVRVIDWQLWHIDLGARDLAFLLALGGFAATRPDIEADLLRVYRETLNECGISITADQLFEDYRISAIRNLNVAVIFRQQGKHPSTWQTALSRAFASYERLKCRELLQ